MPIQAKGFDELARALFDMADHMDAVPKGVFNYVGDLAVQTMQGLAPLGKTGRLKKGIKKKSAGSRSVKIVSEAPYSVPVDQGHKTRQGTGHGENYVPKPGGKTFVPANPFFSSVIGRIAGGDLIKRATVDMNGFIRASLLRYRL